MQYYVTRLDENFREESQEIREFDKLCTACS